MTTELAKPEQLDAATIEKVMVGGDLAKLNDVQRLNYYRSVCDSLGLNPLTRPFEYITLNGKLQLYARKDCTEQLRRVHGVSIIELTSQNIGDVFVVTAKASDKHGRTDAATGAVTAGHLKGDNLANALMKAETKAKRRVTLSLCGLGMLDESETETIPGVQIGEPEPTKTGTSGTKPATNGKPATADVHAAALMQAPSIEALAAYWKSIPAKDRPAVNDIKDKVKLQLTKNAIDELVVKHNFGLQLDLLMDNMGAKIESLDASEAERLLHALQDQLKNKVPA